MRLLPSYLGLVKKMQTSTERSYSVSRLLLKVVVSKGSAISIPYTLLFIMSSSSLMASRVGRMTSLHSLDLTVKYAPPTSLRGATMHIVFITGIISHKLVFVEVRSSRSMLSMHGPPLKIVNSIGSGPIRRKYELICIKVCVLVLW